MSITKKLDSKLNTGEIISVFCNPDDNYSSIVGFLAASDKKYFVLKHVTTEGRYDGYVLRFKDKIFRIDEKTSYENSLKNLYEYYGETHDEFNFGDNLLVDFLNFAKNKCFVIGIGIKDYEYSSILGYVESIDNENESVTVHLINDDGAFDGFSTVAFHSIVRMSCDCQKDNTLKILNSLNK